MKRKELKKLQEDYRVIYDDMVKYLSYKRLNGLAFQEIQKEIYGMCLEHQLQQDQPKDVFGDYQLFCDEISVNAVRQSRQETAFYWLSLAAGCTSLVLCIVTICSAFKPFMGAVFHKGELCITIKDFLPYLLGYANALIFAFVCIKEVFRKSYKVIIATICMLGVGDMLIFQMAGNMTGITFLLPVYPLIFLFFAMTLLFAFRYQRTTKDQYMNQNKTREKGMQYE